MTKKISLHAISLFMAVFMWGCISASDESGTGTKGDPLVVFLVRHAEKIDHSKDADLSKAGYLRSEELARVLSDAEIQRVHSSDFIRTRETAKPVAEKYGLELELYDPRDPYFLADRLKELGGRHLVVGHSNSTPALVEILGGDPGSPIEEMYEYDRLYILTISEDEVQTVLLRYGRSCSSLLSKISASSLVAPQISASALN